MESFRDEINKQLYQIENVDQSIEKLIKTFRIYSENGGRAKFILFPNGDIPCETVLTEEIAESFVDVLLNNYNDMLEDMKKQICDFIDGEIREV